MWDIKYNLQRLHVNCTKDFISPEGNRKIKSAENSGNLSTHICHGVAYNVVQSAVQLGMVITWSKQSLR